MTRPIEFRFHVAGHGMSEVFTLDQILKSPWCFIETKSGIQINLNDPLTNAVQFTGLLDKNGKKIFEGDIVLLILDGLKKELKYLVKWIERKVSFYPFADDFYWSEYEHDFINRCIDSDEVEVIGNIYEHPHLLENK